MMFCIICLSGCDHRQSHGRPPRSRFDPGAVTVNDPQEDSHQRGVEEGGTADVEGPAEVLQQLRFLLFDGHREGDQRAGAKSDCRGGQEVLNEMSCYILQHTFNHRFVHLI